MAELLTIGEVSRRSGVAASALRFYEERGLITSERAQPAGLADRGGEGRSGGARHRRLEDRVLYAEQLGDGGPEHCETDPTGTSATDLNG